MYAGLHWAFALIIIVDGERVDQKSIVKVSLDSIIVIKTEFTLSNVYALMLC